MLAMADRKSAANVSERPSKIAHAQESANRMPIAREASDDVCATASAACLVLERV